MRVTWINDNSGGSNEREGLRLVTTRAMWAPHAKLFQVQKLIKKMF